MRCGAGVCHTELLLDDLEDLLLIELLGQSLNSGQGLTTIAFCAMYLSVIGYLTTDDLRKRPAWLVARKANGWPGRQ